MNLQIHVGDNLPILEAMPSASVDLIYIDLSSTLATRVQRNRPYPLHTPGPGRTWRIFAICSQTL